MMKMINTVIFCVVCFLVGLPGCHSYGNFYFNVTNLSYDPSTKVCCNDKLFDVRNGTKCCGNTVINPSTHQCCDGSPQPLKPGFECCNNILFNVATEKCCYDIVDNKLRIVEPDGNKYTCCNGKLFDYGGKEICCNGMISDNKNYTLECCGNKIIDLKEDICCYIGAGVVKKRTTPDDVCYRGVVLNPTKQLLCNNVVVENPDGNLECCGNDIFDRSKGFLCCWDSNSPKIISKSAPDHDACCGNTTYNSTTRICCQKGDEVKYHPIDQVGNSWPSCCGSGVFDFDKNENCCGDVIYDMKKQSCCQDYVGEKFITRIVDHANARCCGANSYDPETEICCGTTVMEKAGTNDVHNCCAYEYKH